MSVGRLWRVMRTAAITAAACCVCAAPAAARSGDLDPSFGTAGEAVVAFDAFQRTLVREPSGGIDAVVSWGVMRLGPDGALDRSFGAGGLAPAPFTDLEAATMTDRGLVVGGAPGSSTPVASVARLRPDGSLDPAFGSGGVVRIDLGHSGDWVRAVGVQPGGGVIVDGSTMDMHEFVVRLRGDGSLDPAFGDGGVAWPALDQGESVGHAIVTRDGGIVLAGMVRHDSLGPACCLTLRRLDANGRPDPGFGTDGVVRIAHDDPAGALGSVDALVEQPDGRLLVAGFSAPYQDALARFTADGRPDETFGDGGVVRSAAGSGASLAVDAAGRIVATWETQDGPSEPDGTQATWRFARLAADGAPDATFGTGGRSAIAAPCPTGRRSGWAGRPWCRTPRATCLRSGAPTTADGARRSSYGCSPTTQARPARH